MIKRNEESSGQDSNKISSFKKFSEISKSSKSKDASLEDEFTILPEDDSDRPGHPNLPYETERMPKHQSTDHLMPLAQETEPEKKNEVKFYGKIAKLPKGVKASKGFNFLENVKVSKSSIWYIMVEKQDNELQMVKYNHKKGVDLSKFVADLKTYYRQKYSGDKKIVKLIESIGVDGNDKYSCIKNIPLIQVDGKKMISKITEDLIKLLSK